MPTKTGLNHRVGCKFVHLMRKSHHQVCIIQKLVAKEEEEDKLRQAHAQKKAIEDARKNLIKNLEVEQKHMRAEHMRRIKVPN